MYDVIEEGLSSTKYDDYSAEGASTSYDKPERNEVTEVSTLTDYDASVDNVHFKVITPKHTMSTTSEQPIPRLTNPSADGLVDNSFLDLYLPIIIGLVSLLILAIVIVISILKRINKFNKYDVSQT